MTAICRVAIHRIGRLGHYGMLVLVLVGAAWLAISARLAPDVLAEQGPNRAALVVRFSDGTVQQACVSFDTPAISGAELLARSGMQAVMDYNSGLGGAVCSVNGDGCAYPRQDCFCQCQGLRCEYWTSYHWTAGGWQYSQVGASSYQVTDGALEGWSWGQGDFSSGEPPPQVAYTDVCPESALPAQGSQSAFRSLPVPVAQTADSPRDSGAAPSRYVTYPLFAAFLGGACVWVLLRRKGQPSLQRAEDQGRR